MSEPWTIWANCPITRRKSYYLVTDPSDDVVFRNRHLWPCVEFLRSTDVKVYRVLPGDFPGVDATPLWAREQE